MNRKVAYALAFVLLSTVPGVAGAKGKAPAKAKVDPWASPIVIGASDLETLFWPLFDDLAQKQEDEALTALKRDQPATWHVDERKVRAKAAAARKAELKAIRARTYLYRFDASLPAYDARRRGFVIALPGHWVASPTFGTRWTLVLGKKAVVTTRAEILFGQPIERLTYEYAGGERLRWLLKMPLDAADAFMRANWRFNAGPALQGEVLLRVASSRSHKDQPAHRYGRNAANWMVESLKNQKANAGRAILGRLVRWRLQDRSGKVVAESR